MVCITLGARARREEVGEIRGNAKIGAHPSPLPLFLEVLIIEGLERDFSEVLIIGDLKSNGENEIRVALEVLIIKGLKFDFSEVLILEGLRAKKREL
jgi:hypothetical protein